MSPATSLAKPFVRPITLCPYCDHVSPAGSKFCGACGAALHLMPCPQCGAVNDITVATACYRCHRDLHENASVVLPPPPSAAPTEPAALEPKPAEPTPYVKEEPAARQRPHALVVGIVLLAFAAASYYAYRQRTAIVARESAQPETKNRNAADAGANTGAGIIIKAPEVVSDKNAVPAVTLGTKPDTEATTEGTGSPATAPVTPETAATRSSAGRSGTGRDTKDASGASGASANGTTDIARARVDASKGLEKKTPNIGPCTDAVAALGLCTPEPTSRRQ